MKSLAAWTNEQFDPRLSWEDVAWVKEQLGRQADPQRHQDVEDAKLAAQSGADAIVVSNHGGRQLDGAQSSIEPLPAIVAAVGDKSRCGWTAASAAAKTCSRPGPWGHAAR
jgi:L-lactate dehydrogenase (cytochrome)